MYEIFEKLLKEKNVKAADVCRATGIKSPVFSEWKKGKSSPNVDKLILIANYFEVSVEYLRTGKEITTSSYNEEEAKLLVRIRRDKELIKCLDIYFNLSDQKKKHVLELITILGERN